MTRIEIAPETPRMNSIIANLIGPTNIRTMWRMAARIAWRDLRSSPGQWVFTVVTIAVSVASLSGVRSASLAMSAAISEGSRDWIAADASVNLDQWPTPAQLAVIDQQSRDQKLSWTIVTSAMSTAASDTAPDPGSIQVTAVDPQDYPYYGRIPLEPPQSLKEALTAETAVISEEAASRLEARVGDAIRIGGQRFRVAAVFRAEPDRLAGIPGVGMRCIVSREGYVRSGITRGGSFELHRLLIRIPQGAPIESLRQQLEEWFPQADIVTYRDTNPQTLWALTTALSLLDIPPLLALALGGCGVAIAIRTHLDRRMETAAIMKMLGGRPSRIAAVFGVQVFAMTLAGTCLGIPLGWFAERSVLALGARFLPMPGAVFGPREIAQGLAVAGIAILPALLRPYLLIRSLHPAVILRRNTAERVPNALPVPTSFKVMAGIAIFALVAIGLLMGRWDSTIFLFGALSANIMFMWAIAAGALRLAQRVTSIPAVKASVRFGLKNLRRPGSHSTLLIVALGTGLSTIVGTLQTHRAVANAIVKSVPFDNSNIFVAGVSDSELPSLAAFLESIPGAEGKPEILHFAWLRLASIDGVPLAALGTRGRLLPSRWITGCEVGSSPISEVTISKGTAMLMGAKPGSRLQFTGRVSAINLTVGAVRPVDPLQEIWRGVTLDCRALAAERLFHHAAVRVDPTQMAPALRALHNRYPTLAVMSSEDLAATVSELAREVESLVRLLGWYNLAAGVSVLIALVVSTLAARQSELATLALLGATPSWMVRSILTEFGSIGLLAGVSGGLLASGFESLLLTVIFHRPSLAFEGIVAICSTAASVAGVMFFAWLPIRNLLKRSPLDMLRSQIGS